MKTLIKTEPIEGFKLIQNTEIPTPKPDEALIKCQYVAICGSDINLYKWNATAQQIAKLPFTPGHEMTGIVSAIGSKVTNLKPGDRIAVENHFYCGDCYQCKHDRGDICAKMDQYGHGKGTEHGGFSEYSIVPARYCFKLTKNISPVQAVLLEPMGVAHNCLEQIEVQKGDDILIIGAGAIGVLAANICKAMGAERVYVTDINEARLSIAKTMGADKTINGLTDSLENVIMRETDGAGVGKILECSGVGTMLTGCMKYLRKGGYIGLIGLPKEDIVFEDPIWGFVFKSLTMKTVHGRRIFHTWKACEKLISDGLCHPEKCVTDEFGLSSFQDAFDKLFSGEACKIVVNLEK